jgi:type II secretory pathway pseudopilin PulG
MHNLIPIGLLATRLLGTLKIIMAIGGIIMLYVLMSIMARGIRSKAKQEANTQNEFQDQYKDQLHR